MTRLIGVAFFGQLRQKCRDPLDKLGAGTPLPQDDIWGWEESAAAQDHSRGRAGTTVLYFGGNIAWFGLRAQMELSFGYLSRFGDGCYTRELWQ
jgi:hypothetical protein